MAVISLLIAITLPALSTVRESARKVICSSNLRQLGLGMSVFSQDHKDRLPESVFLPPLHANGYIAPSSHRMDTVRLSGKEYSGFTNDELWDGIGMLYQQGYVSAPVVYYCPSHQGNFVYEDAADTWSQNMSDDEIVANYLYRGTGPEGSRVLYNIEPAASLVSDTMRSYQDLNHEGGVNVLQAGLAVNWIDDFGNQIAQGLLLQVGDDDSPNQNLSATVTETWGLLDRFTYRHLKDDD